MIKIEPPIYIKMNESWVCSLNAYEITDMNEIKIEYQLFHNGIGSEKEPSFKEINHLVNEKFKEINSNLA